MTETKQIMTDVKAVGEAGEGVFTAYASVFGNKDSYGDVVLKGAFAKHLEDHGEQFPVYWAHRMDDPDMNVGVTTKAVEDDNGLLVEVQLDVESAKGAQVYRLLKSGRVKQMSFAYDIVDSSDVNGGVFEGGYRELRELKLHEISIVPIGANQETRILSVKQQGEKEPVVEETSTPTKGVDASKIKDAISLLSEVLEELEESDTEDDSAQEDGLDNDQDRETGASEDPGERPKAWRDPKSMLAYIEATTLK